MQIIVYKLSKRFFLTKDIVRHIEGRISILYPSTRKAIQEKVGWQMLKIYFLSFLKDTT